MKKGKNCRNKFEVMRILSKGEFTPVKVYCHKKKTLYEELEEKLSI